MENVENSYVSLVYSMFNQYAFSLAKENIDDLIYYYQRNPATSGNNLIASLMGAIKQYNLESIDLPLFQSILGRSGKSEVEAQDILNKIIEYKQYDKDKIQPIRKYIKDLVATVYVQKANNMYSDDPSGFLKYLRGINFKSTEEDYMTSTSFKNVDINTLIADCANLGIKSSFDWINRAFEPEEAYPRGQMVGICMCPGSGKSLMAANEAVYMAMQKKHCHLLILGDLNMLDQITRMCAIWSGLSFAETKKNLAGLYNGLSQAIGDYLDITIAPAGKITVDEYIEFVKANPKYEVLFIDYDSNFKTNAGDNGLYLEYSEIYEKLTELTLMGKLVFILAQPKVSAWTSEKINLASIGESSRKQHTLDMIITRGREDNSPLPLGIMSIVKNRRGSVGDSVYTYRLPSGRFKVLPRGVYEDLKQVQEYREFTEAELDAMIQVHGQARANIQAQVNQRMQQGGGNYGRPPQGPRPF